MIPPKQSSRTRRLGAADPGSIRLSDDNDHFRISDYLIFLGSGSMLSDGRNRPVAG